MPKIDGGGEEGYPKIFLGRGYKIRLKKGRISRDGQGDHEKMPSLRLCSANHNIINGS